MSMNSNVRMCGCASKLVGWTSTELHERGSATTWLDPFVLAIIGVFSVCVLEFFWILLKTCWTMDSFGPATFASWASATTAVM